MSRRQATHLVTSLNPVVVMLARATILPASKRKLKYIELSIAILIDVLHRLKKEKTLCEELLQVPKEKRFSVKRLVDASPEEMQYLSAE